MPEPSQSVFRAAAIERAASPEQLDHLIDITRPRDWILVAIVFATVATVLVWSVVGRIPTRASAVGIFVRTGERVVDAVSAAAGRLASVDVKVDDFVTKGQPIARIAQTDTEQSLRNARAVLAERERGRSDRAAVVTSELAAKGENFTKLEAALDQIVQAADARVRYLTTELENASGLLAKGYTTRRAVEDRRRELEDTRQRRRDTQNEILKLGTQRTDLETQREHELHDLGARRDEARREVERLVEALSENTQVLSPIDGQVIEVKVAPGSVLGIGTPVIAVETAGSALEVVVYIPADKGKTVKPGMEVRLEPSTVKREEYGTMIGTITRVSEYPVTPQGMLAVLQNDNLVKQFTSGGAPYAAVANLETDLDAPSGYRWAVGSGPPLRLTSGTLTRAEITTRRQRPLDLVLPLVRRLTGITG